MEFSNAMELETKLANMLAVISKNMGYAFSVSSEHDTKHKSFNVHIEIPIDNEDELPEEVAKVIQDYYSEWSSKK